MYLFVWIEIYKISLLLILVATYIAIRKRYYGNATCISHDMYIDTIHVEIISINLHTVSGNGGGGGGGKG